MLRLVLILVLTLFGSEARAWTHGAVCSQGTTALAALSGLSSAQQAAYATMICGMVVDGDFAHLFGLWTATTGFTNSLVNLENPGTNNLTAHVISTIQNPGWQGNNSSMYLDTGLTSGWSQNNASYGTCVLNSRTGPNGGGYELGGSNGNYWIFAPNADGGSTASLALNDATLPGVTINANARGAYAVVRSSAPSVNVYFNGAGIGANPVSDASSGNLTATSIFILAYNSFSTATGFSLDTVGYVWIGDSLVNPTNLYNRLHTFINDTSIGGSAC